MFDNDDSEAILRIQMVNFPSHVSRIKLTADDYRR